MVRGRDTELRLVSHESKIGGELLSSTPVHSKKITIIHTTNMKLYGLLPKWCLLNSQSKLESTALINYCSNSNLRTGPHTITYNLSDVTVTMKFGQGHQKLVCEYKGGYHHKSG